MAPRVRGIHVNSTTRDPVFRTWCNADGKTDFASPITSATTHGRREKLFSDSMTCRTHSHEGPINTFLD